MTTTDASSIDENRERMHRDMLSKVAHDLKSPLASVIGSLQVFTVMQNNLSAEKQRELVTVALQEACRLDLFITNILDMAKLDQGMMKARMGAVDFGALLAQIVGDFENQLHGATVQMNGAAKITLTTDAVLLKRVVALALDNAVKYGAQGAAPAAITIEYGADESVFVRIRDHGAGIGEGQQEKAFEKYGRLDRGEGAPQAGLGLGLSIARGMIELMQGSVTLANHPSGGAVVTLRLPL